MNADRSRSKHSILAAAAARLLVTSWRHAVSMVTNDVLCYSCHVWTGTNYLRDSAHRQSTEYCGRVRYERNLIVKNNAFVFLAANAVSIVHL